MKIKLHLLSLALLALISCNGSESATTIYITPSTEDITLQLREKIEAVEGTKIKIVFDKSVYFAKPDYAAEKYIAVTNHRNGLKRILFLLEGFDSVEIEGNGSEIICHSRIFPFYVKDCSNVKISGLTIDWDIPYLFAGEVVAVNKKEGWRDIRPLEGYSWTLKSGKLSFPDIDGYSYPAFGNTLPFDPVTKRVVPGAKDFSTKPSRVEQRGDVLRFYEKLKYWPPVGSIHNSKGGANEDRYAPAFNFVECKDLVIEDVTVHHALGMGYLFDRTENITMKNSSVKLREGAQRVVSSTADATHFANCKGDILIEGCTFENMLDDGTNVHGTHVMITKIEDKNTLLATLVHHEQQGIKFAGDGDEVWFILAPSPDRHSVNKVRKMRQINEKYMEITFAEELPAGLKEGDIIENKTWNPAYTMRGCTIGNNRARSIVLKTPLKTLIEDCSFASMMSAVLFRGETFFWYESGAVEDVTIRNNYFKNAADCGSVHAVLYVTPRLGKNFDATAPYDKNIVFENNTIDSYLPRLVIADRAEGLVIRGNKIIRNREGNAPFPNDPIFELINCKDVLIEGNSYEGATPASVLKSDERSKSTLSVKNNKNLTIE
ncbi:MAG: right-handed parallel beta-helix repeat-containing protein [Rikenellaceae bacterium]